jgi:hypothetical protein
VEIFKNALIKILSSVKWGIYVKLRFNIN